MDDQINFIVNICSVGQKKDGVENGGDVIIQHLPEDLVKRSEIHRINTYSRSKEPFDSDGYRDCYNLVNELESKGKRWISLGGDHSTAVGTIEPLLERYKDDLMVVWIDAHTDINTFETSNSKNSHGMPVAYLMGLMTHKKPKYSMKPENIVFIGIRDVEPAEQNFLKDLGINYFTDHREYHSISDKSRSVNLEKIVSHIIFSEKKYVHFSIDIDGCDPIEMPSTGTSVNEGLSVKFVIDLIKSLNAKKAIHSYDIVEYNPLIGTSEESSRTVSNIVKILNVII